MFAWYLNKPPNDGACPQYVFMVFTLRMKGGVKSLVEHVRLRELGRSAEADEARSFNNRVWGESETPGKQKGVE